MPFYMTETRAFLPLDEAKLYIKLPLNKKHEYRTDKFYGSIFVLMFTIYNLYS